MFKDSLCNVHSCTKRDEFLSRSLRFGWMTVPAILRWSQQLKRVCVGSLRSPQLWYRYLFTAKRRMSQERQPGAEFRNERILQCRFQWRQVKWERVPAYAA